MAADPRIQVLLAEIRHTQGGSVCRDLLLVRLTHHARVGHLLSAYLFGHGSMVNGIALS